MLKKWSLALVLLILPIVAFAQNTGKIAGRITDAVTGDPLPGAQVIVEGTSLGAAADVNGEYFIIGVPVGQFNVTAKFVGFTDETQQGVNISTGYTTTLNFALRSGVELDEIVVEYERPLIQNDAVGVPKILDGEDIDNLPVRGVNNVASIQSGVVSDDRSESLNIRGGRNEEVVIYIDGVRQVSTTGSALAVPNSAIAEQEMVIGNISARYGDAMSGIINVTTKSGAPKLFGGFEAVTSEFLDPYGYNLAELSVGGPIVKGKANFFLSGSYADIKDSNPSWKSYYQLPESMMDDLLARPQRLQITDVDGEISYVEMPSVAPGTYMLADPDHLGTPIVDGDGNATFYPLYDESGNIQLSDGSLIDLQGGTLRTLSFTPAGEVIPVSAYEEKKASDNPTQRLNLGGNVLLTPVSNMTLKIGGRYVSNNGNGAGNALFPGRQFAEVPRIDTQYFATFTHYLSNSTFYQIQADFSNRNEENYNATYGNDISTFLRLGDIDDPENAYIAAYRDASYQGVDTDGDGTDDLTTWVFERSAEDGQFGDKGQRVHGFSTFDQPCCGYTSYYKYNRDQFRMSANVVTQVGLHQLEFGGEYEQRTSRAWSRGLGDLARYTPDADGQENSSYTINSFSEAPFALLWNSNSFFNYYGYDYNGLNEVDSDNIDDFIDGSSTNIAPYRPLYYGGYVQDKIEYKDLVVTLGLRADVFDNNMSVLKDQYALVPIVRAGSVANKPAHIGDDAAVYFNGDGAVVGYRENNTANFFTADGNSVEDIRDVTDDGAPQITSESYSSAVLTDYTPQVALMPRIGVAFPVTDQALFFARYGVVSQRPSEANFMTAQNYWRVASLGGRISNSDLKPPRTIEYELGLRQRLGERAALVISGFLRQVKDQIQLRPNNEAFPRSYTTRKNVDFGTIKGVEAGFELRRVNNISVNANYTLSFAEGTGSDNNTTGSIAWAGNFFPNFVARLDFDQRHKVNVSLDYRLPDEGPELFGSTQLLANTGVNLLFTAGSGLPYTGRREASRSGVSRIVALEGQVNNRERPATSRLDLKVDRTFKLGGTNFNAYVNVQNLLNTRNVRAVYGFTGLPNDDGYLSSEEGIAELASFERSGDYVWETHYRYRIDGTGNYGIPRQIRLGIRLNF